MVVISSQGAALSASGYRRYAGPGRGGWYPKRGREFVAIAAVEGEQPSESDLDLTPGKLRIWISSRAGFVFRCLSTPLFTSRLSLRPGKQRALGRRRRPLPPSHPIRATTFRMFALAPNGGGRRLARFSSIPANPSFHTKEVSQDG